MAYVNPFKVPNLIPERIDQGVDFSGDGSVLAIGNAQIIDAQSSGTGWPGAGGWVSYRLLDGPAAGREIYVAEDFRPSVSSGQTVPAGTVIGQMFSGSAGIETGWYSGHNHLALAQELGGYSEGDHTAAGDDFDHFLVSLGVPASPNLGHPNRGTAPSGTNWGSVIPGNVSIEPANLTSSILDKLLSMFGVPDIKDLAERAGLIFFGAGLIIAGILIATKKSNSSISESVKGTTSNGSGRSESTSGSIPSDTGYSDTGSDASRVVAGNQLEP